MLFPVLIDEVKIPLEFRRLQAANLIQWQGDEHHEQWRMLVEDLSKVLGPSPGFSPSAEPKEQKAKRQKPLEPPQQKKAKSATTEPLPQETRQAPEGIVHIPKGPFLYGKEKKKVLIDHDFYMDMYPVTNEAFAQFIKAGGYGNESY